MAFPPDDEIAAAIVEFVEKHGGTAPVSEIARAVAKRLKISDTDLSQKIRHSGRPGGESAWKQRLRRVRHTLVKGGKLSAGTPRGIWKLAGR